MSSIITPAVQAIIEFMFPDRGQVIELPNDRFLLNFSDDGEYRIAWFGKGSRISAMDVQTCTLNRADDIEEGLRDVIRDLWQNPHKAKVVALSGDW